MMKQRCLTYLLLLLVALQSVMAVADTHALAFSGRCITTPVQVASPTLPAQQDTSLTSHHRTASLKANNKQKCNISCTLSRCVSCDLNTQATSSTHDEHTTCQHCCHCHGTTLSALTSALLIPLPLTKHQDNSRYLKRAVITPSSSLYRPPIT